MNISESMVAWAGISTEEIYEVSIIKKDNMRYWKAGEHYFKRPESGKSSDRKEISKAEYDKVLKSLKKPVDGETEKKVKQTPEAKLKKLLESSDDLLKFLDSLTEKIYKKSGKKNPYKYKYQVSGDNILVFRIDRGRNVLWGTISKKDGSIHFPKGERETQHFDKAPNVHDKSSWSEFTPFGPKRAKKD